MAAREVQLRPKAVELVLDAMFVQAVGLGPPIEGADPLEKYRWYILGGFGLALVAGAIYITNRSRSLPVPDSAPSDVRLPDTPAKPLPSDRSGQLLEALKDELFQLEVEHSRAISRRKSMNEPERRWTRP